jgi:hypothetical protein
MRDTRNVYEVWVRRPEKARPLGDLLVCRRVLEKQSVMIWSGFKANELSYLKKKSAPCASFIRMAQLLKLRWKIYFQAPRTKFSNYKYFTRNLAYDVLFNSLTVLRCSRQCNCGFCFSGIRRCVIRKSDPDVSRQRSVLIFKDLLCPMSSWTSGTMKIRPVRWLETSGSD